MNTFAPHGLIIWLTLFAASEPGSGSKSEVSVPSIEELIADLGHPVYGVRERASMELWKRGSAARDAVAKAASSPDAEIARRARELLEKFDWGIYPDTPPKVLNLLKEFRSNELARQKAAIIGLLGQGRPGVQALRSALFKSIPQDSEAEMGKATAYSDWKRLSEFVAVAVRREALKQLVGDQAEAAEQLLALNLSGVSALGLADYAAFHYLRGTLADAITRTEALLQAGGPNAAPARLALVYLHRARKDWTKAKAYAEKLPQAPNEPRLLEMLLEEAGEWRVLAERNFTGRTNLPDALRITLHRLAGNQASADREADALVKQAADYSSRDDLQQIVYSLLLNLRAEDATAILLEKRSNLGLLAELLMIQMRYREALEMTAPRLVLNNTDPRERNEYDLRRARLLHQLGRRSEAVQLFSKVADALRTNAESERSLGETGLLIRSLLRAEVRSGLRDLAAEHAAAFLVSEDRRFQDLFRVSESPFEILFESDARPAEALFWVLRQARLPNPSAGSSLRLVRELFTGQASADRVEQALNLLRTPIPADTDAQDKSTPRWSQVERKLAEATILKAVKRFPEAETAYQQAVKLITPTNDDDDDDELSDDRPRGPRSWVYGISDDYRPWLELGDFYWDRGRYAEAAKSFESGWKRFPDQPILLYLAGRALKKSGQDPEGQRRIELSHWISLGNERVRGRFLEELIRRGAANAARRETELLLHACWSRDGYFGNVMNQAARAAVLNKDFATAENCLQRSLLVLMKVPGVHFVETVSYLTVPQNLRALHARALLAQGQLDEALQFAKACLSVQPGNIGMAIDIIGDLDAIGQQAEADQLFRRVWETFTKMHQDYPDSLFAKNSAAWLAANCRRELDQALRLATEAVEAEPTSIAYRETLAEVYFRRGERDKALSLMTQLAQEAPRSQLFRRQLERYRNADPASPFPETERE